MYKLLVLNFLVMIVLGCNQSAFDHSTTEPHPKNIFTRILNSNLVLDTSHELPMDFLVLNENVKFSQYCEYLIDVSGCGANVSIINPKTVQGDEFQSSRLSRFADFPTRGSDRKEVVSRIGFDKPASLLGFETEVIYSNINYGDVFYKDDLFFFENKINEFASYMFFNDKLEIRRGSSLKREFFRPDLDPRDDSFAQLDCKLTASAIPSDTFEKFDLGYFNLNSNKIKSILHTKITKGRFSIKMEDSSTLDLGEATETVLELSAPLANFIDIGAPQILYRNRDIVLKDGKRILSTTYKFTDLK